MNQKDYYQILEVEKSATAQAIKEAFRKQAFQYHPDRNKDNPSAVEKMKEINEAYAVLSDPAKRSDYDTFHDQYGSYGYDRFKQRYSEQDIFRGSDINRVFEEMARTFGVRGFEEVFRESYGPGFHTFQFGRPGFSGGGFVFFGSGFGRGRHQGALLPSDLFPGTLGKVIRYLLKKTMGVEEPGRGKDLEDTIYLDPQQALEGGRGRYHHRKRSKELIINIPPGIKEGQKIRLKGMGAPGKNGSEPGDLYLRVKINRPLLERVKGLLKR